MNELSVQTALDTCGIWTGAPTGRSMLPLLKEGRDRIVITRFSGRARRGDVLLYRRADGVLVLHRVMRVTSEGCDCTGDAQAGHEMVRYSQVLGVLTGFFRKEKYVSATACGYRLYMLFWGNRRLLRKFVFFWRRVFCAVCRRLCRKA